MAEHQKFTYKSLDHINKRRYKQMMQ